MRTFVFTAIIAMSMMLTSCFKDSDDLESYIEITSYVTVCEAEDLADGVSFITDSGISFYVASNLTGTDLTEMEVGERKYVYVKLEASELDDYTYSATLKLIADVVMGECLTIETEEENEALADYPLTYMNTSADIDAGYLNLTIAVDTSNIDDVKYYLVENLSSDPAVSLEDYVTLELRIENSDEEGTLRECEQNVSFSLEPFRTQLTNKYGIVLRINGSDDGIFYYTIN